VDHSICARIIRLTSCCTMMGLLAWVAGCNQTPRGTEHAEVSGKVYIDNKPLPGGQISFVAVKGGFAAAGIIDENGNYKINAPIGEVTITVNNGALQAQQPPLKVKGKGGGGQAPKELPHPKEVAGEVQAIKGRWVSIPSRYAQADTSELKYTVTAGPQTHEVKMTSAPPPPR
jgi:hypothetical protein